MKPLAHLALGAGLIYALAVPRLSQAHGIWFAQRANQLALVYGIGADDLDAVKRLPKVTAMAAYDAAGKQAPTQLSVNGPLLLVDTTAQPAVVAAVLDNGLWSRTADGHWHNQGKDEVPDATVSEHTYKYAVHLRQPLSAPLPVLAAHKLQIVPLSPALPNTAGQPLKLRVLFDGKPVRGAKVQNDLVNDPDAKPVLSGADGTVTVKVRNQGLNVIAATLAVPPAEPAKANREEHLATLSFVLPHQPE